MVTETPDLYREIVKPYIDAFPASRTQWYVRAAVDRLTMTMLMVLMV